MKTPLVKVKKAGYFWAVHVTYRDRTTHVPAYYDNEAWAMYVAGFLQGRYDKAPPAATGETDVLLAIETVIELGGHTILAMRAANLAFLEEGDRV